MPVYPKLFKLRIIDYIKNHNKTIQEVANLFTVSRRSIQYWLVNKHLDNTFRVTHKSKINAAGLLSIREFIYKNHFFNANQIRNYILKNLNISVSNSTIYSLLKKKLNMSFKKVRPIMIRKNEEVHTKNVREFIKKISNLENVYCLDEVHFNSKMKPLYGWANKSEKIMISTKKITNERYSVIATIGDQFIYHKTINGSVKGNSFLDYLKEFRKQKNGKINLLLDNARIHHSKKVKEYAKDNEINLIFNIPYSPETNPIEIIFSKAKHRFRKSRIEEGNLTADIQNAFSGITYSDILNSYRHCFYKN